MKFKNYNVELQLDEFANNNNIALSLVDAVSGEPVARCNVNVDGLAEDEIAVKDYSENEGMLEFLQQNEIVGSVERHIASGFVDIPICKLLQIPED